MNLRQVSGDTPAVLEINSPKENVEKCLLISRPLQRVKIVWTTIDIMLINPRTGKAQRPIFIFSIDEWTGHPLGFYITFDAVDASALKQCLLHTILPKNYLRILYPKLENDWISYGMPDEIVLDYANINDILDFEDACSQLGITLQFIGAGAGNHKGTIERGFRTIHTNFFQTLKGTTFSSTIKKGQYGFEGKAFISLNDFIHMVHIALVDGVAQEYNKNRGGAPAILWKDALRNNPHLSSQPNLTIDELKLLLMGGIKKRTITNKGVAIHNEYFQSYELMDLKNRLNKKYGHSKNVSVRFDFADMRTVYVWDEFKKDYLKANLVV